MSHQVFCHVDGYSRILQIRAIGVPQTVGAEVICGAGGDHAFAFRVFEHPEHDLTDFGQERGGAHGAGGSGSGRKHCGFPVRGRI